MTKLMAVITYTKCGLHTRNAVKVRLACFLAMFVGVIYSRRVSDKLYVHHHETKLV